MSTVQNILDDLQYRLDVSADLYHIINRAIRMIAKRLYTVESNIVVADLNTKIYASRTYTASVAFVDGGTGNDTITDASNGFLDAGFKPNMHIVTDSEDNPGAYKIISVSKGTITIPSGSITGALAEERTITSVNEYFSLPSDFWGLKQNPYVDGHKYILHPLQNQELMFHMTTPSLPKYYDVKGSLIYLYPPPASDSVLKGDYFARPSEVKDKDDVIPFNELFDDAIEEVVMLLYDADQANQVANYRLAEDIIRQYVELIAPKYDRKRPNSMPDGVVWDALV